MARSKSVLATILGSTFIASCQAASQVPVVNPVENDVSVSQSVALRPSNQLVYYCGGYTEPNMPWMGPGDHYYCDETPTPAPTPSPAPANVVVNLIDKEGEKQIFDGENNVFAEIQSVNPVVAVRVPDYEDGKDYNWKERVNFTFSSRRDGTTPVVDASRKYYDDSTKTVYYLIPFKKESILYFGDQWIEVKVNDPKAGQTIRRIPISIGRKTLYSGIPGLSTAYRVSSTSALPVTQVPQGQPVQMELPEEYQGQGEAIPVEANDLFGGTSDVPPEQWVAPVQTAFIIPAVPAVIKLGELGILVILGSQVVLGDKDYPTPKDATEDASNTYIKTHFGKVKVSTDTWNSLAQEKEKSSQISRALAVDCLKGMKTKDSPQFEYWTRAYDNPINGFGIFYKGGNLFYGTLGGANKDALELKSFKVPGFASPTANLWPSNSNIYQNQWGDIAKNIMRFRPDYDDNRRSIWGLNWSPVYRFKYSGDINQPNKPYTIGTNNHYAIDDSQTNHAVPNGAVIVAEPPVFRPGSYLSSHFNNHKFEFSEKVKGTSVYSYNNQPEYQAGAQEMLKGDFHGYKDFYLRSKDLPPGAGDGSRGDVVLFRGRDNAKAVWSYDGFIRTYHINVKGKKDFEADKRAEEFNFY